MLAGNYARGIKGATNIILLILIRFKVGST